jgi:hypothetical protein
VRCLALLAARTLATVIVGMARNIGRAEQDRGTHDAEGHDDRMELHGATEDDGLCRRRS